MDGCNWNDELTQSFWKRVCLQVLVSKKHSIFKKRSLQKGSWNKDSSTQMYDYKCSSEIAKRLK